MTKAFFGFNCAYSDILHGKDELQRRSFFVSGQLSFSSCAIADTYLLSFIRPVAAATLRTWNFCMNKSLRTLKSKGKSKSSYLESS